MTLAIHEVNFRQALVCHAGSPCPGERRLEVAVSRRPDDLLSLTFVINGDLTGLQVPPAVPRRRADGLWRHTCFEAFVAIADSAAYYEFNFSPSGEWAAYGFSRYREGAALAVEATVSESRVSSKRNQLSLEVAVHLSRLPNITVNTLLRLGLSAVLEEEDGRRSYWAVRHPPGKPDFHHADTFALEINPCSPLPLAEGGKHVSRECGRFSPGYDHDQNP
jgi:hypothetical protein